MDRKLAITGVGKLSVSPDLIIIDFPLHFQDHDYGTAIEKLNIQVNLLRGIVESCGVDKKKLKTQNFRVNTVTTWNKKTEKNEFCGFNAQHDMTLEIPLDNDLTNMMLRKVSHLDSKIEYRISFGVIDKDKCLALLIENAIQNAKEKASLIAKSSEVKLKEILNINYSFSDIYFHSETDINYNKNLLMESERMPDITPKDIDLSENVTITWRIE